MISSVFMVRNMIKSPAEGIEVATETKGTQGKSANQKLKTYLVMQYLLHLTDERHPATMEDIRSYLKECGIESERRSI